MPIFVSSKGVREDIFREIARVQRIAVDLELVARGQLPSEETLLSAPLMDAWTVALREVPWLVGICGNQPRLNGPVVTTMAPWVFVPDLHWARTLSRFYRLGTPRPGGGGR